MLVEVLIAVGVGLVVAWLALVIALLLTRPSTDAIRESLRPLPDLLRLVHRLARDPTVPRSVRVRPTFLLLYLAMPIDLVPDFIPVLGYVDDVIITIAVLRGVVRTAGPDAVRRHWPGTTAGLAALAHVTRLSDLQPPPDHGAPPLSGCLDA